MNPLSHYADRMRGDHMRMKPGMFADVGAAFIAVCGLLALIGLLFAIPWLVVVMGR